MLKFEFDTSPVGVSITRPINQPVRGFKITKESCSSSKRFYTEVGADVAFTVGWLNRFYGWFWATSIIEAKGNVPSVKLRAERLLFNKVALYDDGRRNEIVWHSSNQYLVRDADQEIARIYIYKASFNYTDSDNYVLTLLDEEFDLTVLFLYVFCFKFVMNDRSDDA